jgi:hypothetical protein
MNVGPLDTVVSDLLRSRSVAVPCRGRELALSEFESEREPDRIDLDTCLTHPESAVDSLAWWMARFRSGRSVARQPATMQAPASIVLHIEMLTTFQKKSSVWVRPST